MSSRYDDLALQDLEGWCDGALEDAAPLEDAAADTPAHVCQCAHLWEHHYLAQRGCSACPCVAYQDDPAAA